MTMYKSRTEHCLRSQTTVAGILQIVYNALIYLRFKHFPPQVPYNLAWCKKFFSMWHLHPSLKSYCFIYNKVSHVLLHIKYHLTGFPGPSDTTLLLSVYVPQFQPPPLLSWVRSCQGHCSLESTCPQRQRQSALLDATPLCSTNPFV